MGILSISWDLAHGTVSHVDSPCQAGKTRQDCLQRPHAVISSLFDLMAMPGFLLLLDQLARHCQLTLPPGLFSSCSVVCSLLE